MISRTKRSLYSRPGERVGYYYHTPSLLTFCIKQGKYKIDIDLYHRKVKPKFIAAFQNQYGAKKFNDMYVGHLETKLAYFWNKGYFYLRCGKNPDFDIDKEGWVWPNGVKGKSCSKVFFISVVHFSLKTKKIYVFQKDYILDLGDTIVLECQKNPNCLQLNGELSVFETWGTGK